jgi:hypothetical protein
MFNPGTFQRKTSTKGLLVSSGVDEIIIHPIRKFKQEWIRNSLPLIGRCKLIIVNIKNVREKTERYAFSMRILSNQQRMELTQKNLVVEKNCVNQTIMKEINESFEKFHQLIIIGSNKLGPLIKKDNVSIDIIKDEDKLLYVPDMLLFSSLKSKINLVEKIDMTKVHKTEKYHEEEGKKKYEKDKENKKIRNDIRKVVILLIILTLAVFLFSIIIGAKIWITITSAVTSLLMLSAVSIL